MSAGNRNQRGFLTFCSGYIDGNRLTQGTAVWMPGRMKRGWYAL